MRSHEKHAGKYHGTTRAAGRKQLSSVFVLLCIVAAFSGLAWVRNQRIITASFNEVSSTKVTEAITLPLPNVKHSQPNNATSITHASLAPNSFKYKPFSTDICRSEKNAEYAGEEMVKWGGQNIKESSGACCEDCKATAGCNVWVYCDSEAGCGQSGERKHKECWLKKASMQTIVNAEGKSHPDIHWTSGAVYDEAERQSLLEAEASRLAALREQPDLPLVYLDVAIKGELIGRIEIVLFSKESPRWAENFRALSTGEKGEVPAGHEGAGKKYHFKGAPFYRIIDQFICQAGAWTDSVFGGTFKDDEGGLKLVHNRKGLLSAANSGPDSNTSHFSIMMGPAPHLNGHYTIFGEVVSGFEVVERVNTLSRGQPDNTVNQAAGVTIADSGQLREGKRGNLNLK